MRHPLPTSRAWLLAVLLLLPACGGDDPAAPAIGTPAAITDLEAVAGANTSVTLAWTVPGAATKAGGAITYDLRYIPLGEEGADRALWAAAPAPGGQVAAGQRQQHVVAGLAAGETYVFSLAARYDGAWSSPSAPAVGTAAAQPDQTPPARPLDLAQHAGTAGSISVAWSLAGDDSIYGRAASYQVRYAVEPLTAESWATANAAAGAPVAHANPGKLVLSIDGLIDGQTYHVGLKAIDDAGHASALSNVVVARAAAMRTIYVRADGSGDYAKLNDAIHAATPGDVVLVAPGRYTWSNQGDGDPVQGLFVVRRDQTDFTIRGEGGASVTILDAELQGRVMYVVGGTFGEGEGRTWAGVTIEGFTFVNGRALGTAGELGPPWAGAGLALHLTDTLVRDCVFRDNRSVEGGAVWMGGQGGSRLENCLLENNAGEFGGAVFLVNSEPVMSVSGCVIRNNTATLAGGGLYAYNVGLELDSTLIHGNTAADKGGALYLGALHAGSWLEGCTIIDNVAPVAGAIRTATNMTVEARRCLVANNRGGSAFASIDGGVLAAGCGLVFGNPGGNAPPADYLDLGGNLVTDPLLCADGLHPSGASPCLPANRAGGDDCGIIGALGADCGS